jgi:hypothetical protein
MSIPNKIIAIIGLIMALIAIHTYDKQSSITKAVQEVHQSYSVAAKQVADNAKIELGVLRLEQQKERENKDEKIRNIGSERDAALRMLAVREKRPKDSGEHSKAREACTGGELYREDGEFLTREAARADEVVVERDFYFGQYESVRLMIERINDGKR